MKEFDQELLSGSILRSVWKLSWPAMLLHLVNGLHGFVDHVLVGNILGSDANAGIGVAWQVFLVVVVFLASLFHGMGVLIARYAGKQDRDTLSYIAYQTFLTSLIVLTVFVAPIGFFLSPYLLEIANADNNVQAHALPYLRIMFTCGAPLFLMFMINGAMHASGDPKTPLKLAILTTLINIGLSVVLISGLGPFPKLGAAGAGLATCLAPLVSLSIALGLIVKGKLIIRLPEHLTLLPDLSVMRTVARIGIPTGFQGVLLNVGGVLLLRYIGSLEHGAAAQGAYTICYAQLFSFVAWAGFGLRSASATVIGQNIGAGNPERGKRGVRVASFVGLCWAAMLGVLFWTIPEVLLGMFNAAEEPVLGFGSSLLKFMAFSGLFLVMAQATTGGLQGAGDTKRPMYIAFVTQIVVLLGACAVFDHWGRLTASTIWAAILVSHMSRFFLTEWVFRGGKWADITIDIAHPITPNGKSNAAKED